MRCRPILRVALFVALACSFGAGVLACVASASADIDIETCPALVGEQPEAVPGKANTSAILYAPPEGDPRSPNLERLDCAHPFTDARAVEAVAPDYPFARAMENATSLVEITIDPTGVPAGSYVFRPSSELAFDIATVQAALHTTYASATAFCRPIYSRYIFRADFSPK